MTILKTKKIGVPSPATSSNKSIDQHEGGVQNCARPINQQDKPSRRASSAIIDEKIRAFVRKVIFTLRHNLDDLCTDEMSEHILQVLTTRDGAGKSDMLKLLITGIPADLAKRMPDLLESIGAQPSTAMVSTAGKESVHRIETAIYHLKAFIALTDLQHDISNPTKFL